MEQATKIILHYSKGLQQTCSGHWSYNGHVLYNFIALRAIKGLETRAEAERFAAAYIDNLNLRVAKDVAEAMKVANGEPDSLSSGIIAMEAAIYRQEVLECLKPGIELMEHQISALTSFAHSIGIPSFSHSGTVKAINFEQDLTKAADLIMQWNKINTMGMPYHLAKQSKDPKLMYVSDVLTARRKCEKNLFLTGQLVF